MPESPPVSEARGPDQKRGKIFYGWWVLIFGSLINLIGSGLVYHGFTVFFLPVKRDLAVTSAALSLLYGAARLEGGMDGAIYGYLIDRFGPRRMILIGTSLSGIGFFLLATVQSYFAFFLIYLLTISVGMNAGFYHPVSTAVNRWFIRRRGLAFSILTAFGSLGGVIMAPILSYIILSYGWRSGAVLVGVLILAVALPAGIPIRRSPEGMGLPPDGSASAPQGAAIPRPQVIDVNYTVREAVRTPQFWMLTVSISLRIMVTVALNTHFVPLFVWKGMSEAASAYMVSLMAFTSIPLALLLGWIGDRWDKLKLCSLCCLPTIAAMVGMIFGGSRLVLYLFPVVFALTFATAPLNWALIGDFFGRRSYGTLRGIMGFGYGTATFISPLYAGWIFDRTNSYSFVLWTFAGVLLVTAVLFALLRRPERRAARVEKIIP